MKNSIKIATIISYITLILGNVISLLYTPFMLSTLGSKEYGVFSLVNTIISYMYLLDMGIGNAVIRYNAKYMAENDRKALNNINGMFLSMYSIIALIGLVLGVLLYNNIDNIFSKGLSLSEISILKVMFIISITNMVCSFPLSVFNGIIIANERFVFIKMVALVKSIFNPVVMVSVLLLGYRSIGMVTISTIFNISIGIINVIYCLKVLKVKFDFNQFNISILKEVFNYSFFIFLGAIAYQIYWSTDQLILGIFVSATSIAIYSVGAQFNSYFTSFSNVISSMFLPKLTKIVSTENNKEILMSILIKVSRIQLFIATLILMGFVLVGKPFIKLWAGEDYELSYYIALLVMIPQIFSIVQSLFATMLEAMNKHKVKSFIYLGVSILNLALSLLLVGKLGPIGCALGTGIGMSINAILNNLYYKYKLNLNMSYYWKEILKLLPSTIVGFLIGNILLKYIDLNNYISIGIFVLCFSLIYFIVWWVSAFNEYEKNIILSLFKKFNFKIINNDN